MELQRALSQISEIHAQVLRSEVFRGYRAVPMAITAVVAVTAAGVQDVWLSAADTTAFALYWIGVAVICSGVCGIDLWVRTRFGHGVHRRLAPVLAQFLPALAVGAAVTSVLLLTGDQSTAGRLPGWWAILFGLGVFASRPYLCRAVGWVGVVYLTAGLVLLATTDPGRVPSPWSMGLTFGVGQATLSLVLYCAVERRSDGC